MMAPATPALRNELLLLVGAKLADDPDRVAEAARSASPEVVEALVALVAAMLQELDIDQTWLLVMAGLEDG